MLKKIHHLTVTSLLFFIWGYASLASATPDFHRRGPVGLANEVFFRLETATDLRQVVVLVSFENNTNGNIPGSLTLKIIDSSNRIVHAETVNAILVQGKGPGHEFSFRHPLDRGFYRISFEFEDQAQTACIEQEISYVNGVDCAIPSLKMPNALIGYRTEEVYRITPQTERPKVKGDTKTDEIIQHLMGLDENQILTPYLDRFSFAVGANEMSAAEFITKADQELKSKDHSELKKKLDKIVCSIIFSQTKRGYLGRGLADGLLDVEKTAEQQAHIRALMDFYMQSGYLPALTASKKAADLIISDAQLPDSTRGSSLVGALPLSAIEPLVDLYRFTGQSRYLHFAEETARQPIQNDVNLEDAALRDQFIGVYGLIKLHNLTGNPFYLEKVKVLTTTIEKYLSKAEDVSTPTLELWALIHAELGSLTGDLSYFREIDPLLNKGNKSLASANVDMDHFMSNPFGTMNNHLICSFYHPGSYRIEVPAINGSMAKVDVTLMAPSPKEGMATLAFVLEQQTGFTLMLRVPEGSRAFKASVNGKEYWPGPDGLINIQRYWSPGDAVFVDMGLQANSPVVPAAEDQNNTYVVKKKPIRRSW